MAVIAIEGNAPNPNFNQKLFLTLLQAEQINCGLNFYPELDSTNEEMGRLIDRRLSLPRVAIAARQSAGRGQWGRQWQSELGGLYLTLGLKMHLPIAQAFYLTLMAVTAIGHGFHQYEIPVGIKWPNDLILNKKKLGGIKTEIRTEVSHGNWIITHGIIGVGINWQNPTPDQAISLKSFGPNNLTSWEHLAAMVTRCLINGHGTAQLDGLIGEPDELVTQYNQLLVNRGKTLEFAGNRGTIEGITPQGALQLKVRTASSYSLVKIPIGTLSLGYDNL
ncbi:MAG: biotin--[acetyl-CoA-carboxylase] ligase [Synechococcaceae cyanobacterium RL_1_2]|nr:biotin--[acetyl-CoA-carboxylase] ligase [Synechococcaceae cyanobacterium RL_1_2]